MNDHLPLGIYAKVVHLHQGNTTRNQLKKIGKTNARYITICRLYDDDHQFSIAKGMAVCGKKDAPSRQLGRTIAMGRALKEIRA